MDRQFYALILFSISISPRTIRTCDGKVDINNFGGRLYTV